MVRYSNTVQLLFLLLIILSQVFCSYFLAFKNSWSEVFDKMHSIIYLSTSLCVLFFYFINNSFSFPNTENNFKGKNQFNWAVAALTGIGALVLSYAYYHKLGLVVTLVITLELFYALFIKRLPVIGNLVLASLNALSLLIFLLFDPNIKPYLILLFTIFIFGIHFIIDFIKDILNNQTETTTGNYTLPALAGNRVSKFFLIAFLFIYILVLTTSIRLVMVKYFGAPLSYIYLTYNILCLGIPLFRLLSKLQTGNEDVDYKYLYQIACYILITGIFSMMFF